MSIYVANLSYDVTEADLIAVFSEYGSVKRVQIPKDRETGRLRGFGFVEMSTDAEEAAAIEALDGEEWMGRDLKVNKAKPREERSTSSAWRLDSGIAVAIGGESNIRDDKSNRQQPADPGQKTTPNSQHQRELNALLKIDISRQELSASKEVTMVLKGHLKDVSKTDLAILRNQLRKISCDQSIEIVQIEEGSIVLKLTGTDEGFKVIKDLWETGKLTTLIGLSIEAVDYEVLSPDDHGEDSVSVPIVNTERVSLSDSQYPEGSANFFFDRCVVNQSNQISVAESVTQASAQSAGIYMSESENYVNNLQGATIANMANAIKDNGRQQANQHIHPEHQKTLVEAFWDIQQLLKKLEQDEPEASDSRKITYVNDETSPSFKHRAASALLAGGETAIEELLDNPYLNIGKAIIKGWIKPG